jgi:hypothetical protein
MSHSPEPKDLVEDSGRTSSWSRARLLATIVGVVLVVVALAVVARSDGTSSTVAADDVLASTTSLDLPTTTQPSVPDPLQPVDPSTLENGYYLRITTPIFSTADEPLLAAARELALEARNAGYNEAKIVRRPASDTGCKDGLCVEGVPPIGYVVLLKGPYTVPADVTDEYEWRRRLWLDTELPEAKTRNLTAEPRIYWFNFDALTS